MNAALSAAIKEAYAVAPAGVTTIDTIQLSHPNIVESVYLVKSVENMELTLEDASVHIFKSCGFEVTLPGTEAEMNISICNVDRSVTEFMELAAAFRAPVEVTFRPYLSSDLTQPQMDPPLTMFLNNAVVELMNVSGRATFANALNKKFPTPAEYYTAERFPGL